MPRLQATQANYPFVVKTPLKEDKLLFYSMSATEQLGRLFEYDLELLSNDSEIKLDEILGGNVTVQSHGHDGQPRFFNGYVSRFSQTGMHGDYFVYQATLRPWFWFLTRTADCRIFQEKTVPDIIKDVFRDRGFSDFEESLSQNYRTWNYCVQYRETDFNFISRLMEQEGIYYYFKHENGKHSLVISDSIGSHEAVPGYEEVPYYPPEETDRRERDYISSWTLSQEIQPGVYALNDFDFEKPKANLQVKSAIQRDHEQASFEVYDYPGEYLETGDGENYVRARIEELQAQYELVHGSGNVSGLTTGCLFNLTNYGREDQNREYLVVSATYDLGPQEYESRSGENDTYFTCAFKAIDSQQPFRSTRTTPKPVVQGPQTAVVVGKSGEEIWTDEHGRVKIQFHWDRYGTSDENSSCWIRVSQVHAGKSFGGIDIPRIGEEVIVDFLEGDPDRPIITGRVYNGDNKPPNGLPAAGMVSGLKSNSTPGGGGNNAMMMDDTKGKEAVTIHAQYNMDTTVENDQTNTVNNNRTSSIAMDDTESVGSNQTIDIGSNQEISIGSDQNITIGSNQKLDVGADQTIGVGANQNMTIGSNQDVSIGTNQNLAVGSNQESDIGADRTTSVGASDKLTVGGQQKISVSGPIEIESGTKITLKGGGSMIEISAGGIVIQSSALITVQGSIIKLN